MDVVRFGLALRALRHRRGWRQADVAGAARVSRQAIGRVERGGADRVTVRALERIAGSLGARVDTRLLWQGEALDRLLDRRHAALVERLVGLLGRHGWQTAVEVTYGIAGERGSIDVLAHHGPSGALLVVEVKCVIPDLQATLANLDRKARLAREVAADRGWPAATVSRLLVVPGDRTARRRVAAHSVTFDVALPARTMAVRRWLERPTGTLAGLMFVPDAPQTSARHRVSSRRGAAPRSTGAPAAPSDPESVTPSSRSEHLPGTR